MQQEVRSGFLLRLPIELKVSLSELARENRRSTTREIQHALEKYVAEASPREQSKDTP
jgi:predicted transcriptional regulator